jgi:tRNA-Thr(GGU) m(6)t(6)A37 methyltransferase TsaA
VPRARRARAGLGAHAPPWHLTSFPAGYAYDGAIGDDLTRASFPLRAVGRVDSPLKRPEDAPKQGIEGAPDAWIVFDEDVVEAARDLRPGDEVLVMTWLQEARRDVLAVHPRDDPTVPERGVFSTRSQDRPNPIGLHLVEIAEVDGSRVRVRPLEAIDGTPVVDVKPVLRHERG